MLPRNDPDRVQITLDDHVTVAALPLVEGWKQLAIG